ncbi:unnamed protein product [Moneuplotes crassus]|uniref:Uncharacterized protein n=1 Tax=Euplotes crassus TaxID=5936 RepID=A0AAD1UGU9_EUPCR|nr:unnamed protein product [Moneuplotes crassus]
MANDTTVEDPQKNQNHSNHSRSNRDSLMNIRDEANSNSPSMLSNPILNTKIKSGQTTVSKLNSKNQHAHSRNHASSRTASHNPTYKNTKSVISFLKYHTRNHSSDKASTACSKREPPGLPICYQGQRDWSKDCKGVSFTSSIRKNKLFLNCSGTPGPGTYGGNYFFGKCSKAATLKSKITIKNPQDEIPGPGHYKIYQNDEDPELKAFLNLRFGRSNSGLKISRNREMERLHKSFEEKRLPPNATKYSPNYSHVLPSVHKCSFGKSGKSQFLKQIYQKKYEPGPGAHEVRRQVSGPSFSISWKPKRNSSNGVPGPGEYTIKRGFIPRTEKAPSEYIIEKDSDSRHSYLKKTGNIDYLGSYYRTPIDYNR